MATDESTTGLFQDKKEDFRHLSKTEIYLLVQWEDEDLDPFKNQDVIKFSVEDSLFEQLTRRLKFEDWGTLAAVRGGAVNDIRTTLYQHPGKTSFDTNPQGHYQQAKAAVDNRQRYLEEHPSAERCTFILTELSPRKRSRAFTQATHMDGLLRDLKILAFDV